MPALEEGFVAAMKLPGGAQKQEMCYEQFDAFLSAVKTSQVHPIKRGIDRKSKIICMCVPDKSPIVCVVNPSMIGPGLRLSEKGFRTSRSHVGCRPCGNVGEDRQFSDRLHVERGGLCPAEASSMPGFP